MVGGGWVSLHHSPSDRGQCIPPEMGIGAGRVQGGCWQ